MANTLTLTSLTELLYQSRDTVLMEPVGFIPSVLVNSGSEGVSIGGTVNSLRTPIPTLNTSYTPAMTIPAGDDQTMAVEQLTIDQVANVRVPLTGEAFRQLQNTVGFENAFKDVTAQAIRRIRNAIEAHCGTVLKNGASRATGTSGTTPFASNHNSVNAVRQILIDNGAPDDGQLSLVLNTSAGTNLRNLSNLYKVNEAGTAALLNNGVLIDISGIKIRESAGVASHTKGAATGALINNASGEVVGETTLTLDTITVNTTGILAGDVVTFAVDTTNQYVVKTGLVATSGDIVIGRPGALIALPDNNAMTITNSYTANVAFHKNAVELVMRPPSMPPGGDAATDRMTIYDEKSGLVFEVAQYKGYGMNMLDFTCFYKAKVWKEEMVAILKG